MRRMIIILVILLWVAPASAQVIRRPYCDYWCRVLGVPPDPFRRVMPVEPIRLKRRVSAANVWQECGSSVYWGSEIVPCETMAAKISEYGDYGLQAAKLWPKENFISQDVMDAAVAAGIDTLVIRPMHWSLIENSCAAGGQSVTHEYVDYGAIADWLYELYGDYNLTIVLTNWEGDWQLRGYQCKADNQCAPPADSWWTTTCPDEVEQGMELVHGNGPDVATTCCRDWRWHRAESWFTLTFNARQEGVAAAREAHRGARLKVYHAIVVNFADDRYLDDPLVVRDVIPNLTYQPDLIGLSFWRKNADITDELNFIQAYTGYSREHIYVDEIGAKEKSDGDQYGYLLPRVSSAFDWGVKMVFVWRWKSDDEYSLWQGDQTTSGFDAIMDLQGIYEE